MSAHSIGVCSWSLRQPDLATTLRVAKDTLGLNVVQLGLFDGSIMDPANDQALLDAVAASGMTVSATCVGFAGEDYSSIDAIARTGGYRLDDDFENRFAKTVRVRDVTAAMGVDKMTTHIGFVPTDRSDAAYATMVDRMRRVADMLADKAITLTMETGQEPAMHLRDFIDELGRDNIRVNFDPANMILYGCGDPVEAVGILADRIAHVHAKDAVASDQPGKAWGQEVPLGQGQANIPAVIAKLDEVGYTGPFVIEREAGDNRIADVRTAIDLLRSLSR